MAHLHFRRTVYKSGGAHAVGRVAYITRQPVHTLSRAEQQLRYIGHDTRLSHQREDVVYTNHRNLPAWSQHNPHTYFQAAEAYERAGGVAFEEWKISVPVELSHRQNMALTRDLIDAIAGDTLPVTYAFHDPATMDGTQPQPHLHLLLSARKNDEHARTPDQHFRRYNRAHPEHGGAQKDPAINHMGAVKAHRVMVSDIVNLHLEQAGHAARVHPERLVERGIDRTPEPKLLPSESRHYRAHGRVTERMQQVFEVRAERQQSAAAELADAQRAWTRRKLELGITRDMPMAERLARSRDAREHAISHAPERRSLAQLQVQEQALAHSVQGLERYVQTVQHSHRREQRIEQRREPRAWGDELAAEQVLAAGTAHGLPRDPTAEQMVAQIARFVTAQAPRLGMETLDEEAPTRGARFRERGRGMDLGW